MAIKAHYDDHSGRWRCRRQETYKGVTWLCYGTSRESAAGAKENYQRNRDTKIAEINGVADRKVGKIKLSVAMPEWYDTHLRGKMTHGRPRSLRTIQTDESTMTQIINMLGDYNVCDIDSNVIQRYLNNLAAGGAGSSTVRKQWLLLHQFFDNLNKKNNPMDDCHKPVTQDIQAQYNGATVSKTAYTDAEMERLTASLVDIDGARCQMLIIVMWQFLRIGEAIELRVKDIDLIAGIIHIRRQYDERHKVVVRPKDNSVRDIPISWRCVDILMSACAGKDDDDLLFVTDGRCNNHEGRLLRSAMLDNLSTACEQAEIERHTVHDLRHDGISYYVRHGYKPVTIQRWAGHSSLSVTLDKYYRDTGIDDPRDVAIMTTGKEPGTVE